MTKKIHQAFTTFCQWFLLSFGGLLLINQGHFLWGTALNFGRWIMVLSALALAIHFYKKRKKGYWLVNLVLIVLFVVQWAWHISGFADPVTIPKEVAKAEISILSYNLLFEGGNSTLTRKILKENPVDIIVFQEYTPYYHRILPEVLNERYPYHLSVPIDHPYGIGIYSRYPLRNESLITDPQYGSPRAQCTEVVLPEAHFYLCNTHFSSSADAFLDSGRFLKRFQQNVATRTDEWIRLIELIGKESRKKPAVIAGDFNTLPFEPLYGIFRQSCVDAFSEAGSGFGFTFPNISHLIPFPLARIDYVLVQGEVMPISAKVLPESGSDHLPLKVKLRF